MAELHIDKGVISHKPQHERGLQRFNLENYEH
jgi:hypothetical protein